MDQYVPNLRFSFARATKNSLSPPLSADGDEHADRTGADNRNVGSDETVVVVVIAFEADPEPFEADCGSRCKPAKEVGRKRPFDAATGSPSVIVVGIGEAACAVNQETVEGHTGAGPYGSEPFHVVLIAEGGRDKARWEARWDEEDIVVDVEVGPLNIRLDTNHERAELIVVADSGHRQRSRRGCCYRRRCRENPSRRQMAERTFRRYEDALSVVVIPPAVAGVHADIESGPREDRDYDRRREVRVPEDQQLLRRT